MVKKKLRWGMLVLIFGMVAIGGVVAQSRLWSVSVTYYENGQTDSYIIQVTARDASDARQMGHDNFLRFQDDPRRRLDRIVSLIRIEVREVNTSGW
jgi:hypothetical protein